MKPLCILCLAWLILLITTVGPQAQMVVVFQQKDSVILMVKVREKKFLTSDYETFHLDSKEVLEKASALQGQTAHILHYQKGQEKHCTDLRSSLEASFDLP
jgi:hypothetical protein